MEGCDSLRMSTIEDGISFCGSRESDTKNLSMNDLISYFSASLKVQIDHNSSSGFTTNDCNIYVANKDEINNCHESEIGNNGLEEKKEDSTQNVQQNSANQPTGIALVSALKGSREKQGKKVTEKLSVKWAPEVYDPVPTASCHVPTNNNKSSHRHKKNGKNKHGKSSSRSSSKGKEKKQVRKSSSGARINCSSNWYDEERSYIVTGSEQLSSIVGSPEQFCGTSFLINNSITKMHFPVGEAS